jgi:hypothetical protein
MVLIREIVQQALTTGYLTITAQEQLRQLLQTTKYGQEDINAFMTLQQAAMDGHVKQEATNLIKLIRLQHRSGSLMGKKLCCVMTSALSRESVGVIEQKNLCMLQV